MEYIIYCDESISDGRFYSNFYGGALVRSGDLECVAGLLNGRKAELNLHNEIKWTKVTENYLGKYTEMMTLFFHLIAQDKVKIRIMFSQNAQVPANLTREHRDNGFHILYYHFVKHAFGLQYHYNGNPTFLRLYFDLLPDTKLKNEAFKSHIYGLQGQNAFKEAGVKIRLEDIVEVDSHDHVILQCMDIVLGAMAFRLNDMHKQKSEQTNKRGRKTIAKEKLYKHILERIRNLGTHPNFNIGISTGRKQPEDLWIQPYRHWKFVPKQFTEDRTKYK